MPEVPRFAMYAGCVLDQLSWQMQRSGLLTATARLVAQGGRSCFATCPEGGWKSLLPADRSGVKKLGLAPKPVRTMCASTVGTLQFIEFIYFWPEKISPESRSLRHHPPGEPVIPLLGRGIFRVFKGDYGSHPNLRVAPQA